MNHPTEFDYEKAESTHSESRQSRSRIIHPLVEDLDFSVKHIIHPANEKERDTLEPVVKTRNELRYDCLACFGELVGTFLFLYLSFTSAQSAVYSGPLDNASTTTKDNQTILFIALSFGMSLLVTAWVFFRITGAAFNPAVSFSLWLIGGLSNRRLLMIVPAQMIGGIAAAGLAKSLTLGTFGVETTLAPGVSNAQGLFIEMFTTALLCFTVLMCAAEKSKSSFLAPVAIGLALFIGHLGSIGWTGAGINPARSFGPSVVNGHFTSNAWLYYVGQMLGSLVATSTYAVFKHFDYTEIVGDIDSDDMAASGDPSMGPMMRGICYCRTRLA
ncbi:hypothetical protein RQP46_005938 [Phenoliferia psychrophenolica]